jgi:hypothetical protein
MMPRTPSVASVAIAAAVLVGAAAAAHRFDGSAPEEASRPLTGWSGGSDRWRIEDDLITAEITAGETLSHNEFLWWDGTVGDFDLSLEYRIEGDPSANSGIQFRSERLPDGHAKGYQADLDDGATWLGRIYDEHGRGLLVERGVRLAIAPDGRTWSDVFAPPEAIRGVVRAADWNRYRIRATAAHVTVWVNDTLAAVLDDRDAKHAEFSGRLALQLHSGPGPAKLQFRNIRLTDLGTTAAGQESAAAAAANPQPGRDWSSPVLWHTVANQPAKPSGAHPLKRSAGQGLDRIVILADGNGDGSFETRKVFKEGLNLVSGLEVGFGGVYVGAAPHLLFFADRDGDDVPDGEPEILLDGWGHQDTHETLNSFTWGPDGWLYGCHGVFTTSDVGRPGAAPEERQRIKAGIWRYHPIRKQFEIFAHGGSNQWGIDFSSVGDAFMTHCRSFYGGGGTTHILRNGIYWNQSNAGYPAFICSTAPPFAPDLKN